jgi:hypothetical protein
MLVATAGNASVFALDIFLSREFLRPLPRPFSFTANAGTFI